MDTKKLLSSPTAGGIVGVFVGGLTVLLLEAAGHALFGTADLNDLASVTPSMFASVLVAWIVASWFGATVATVWSKGRTVVPGLAVGIVLLAGSVSNFFIIPHPVWMIIAAVVLMPAAAYLGARWRLAPAAG